MPPVVFSLVPVVCGAAALPSPAEPLLGPGLSSSSPPASSSSSCTVVFWVFFFFGRVRGCFETRQKRERRRRLSSQSAYSSLVVLPPATYGLGVVVQIDGVECQEVGRDKRPDEHRLWKTGRMGDSDASVIFSTPGGEKRVKQNSEFFSTSSSARARGTALSHSLSLVSARLQLSTQPASILLHS